MFSCFTQAPASPGSDDDDTAGAAWEEERRRLLYELEQRDALLAVADEHMETEIDKLHDQLQRQHNRQLMDEVKVSAGTYVP
jgi:hypothetical protein